MKLNELHKQLGKSFLRHYFTQVEKQLLDTADELQSPPIFIVGPPRSGTTLVYQAMSSCLRTSYLSTFASWYPATPAAATRYIKSEIITHLSDYRSDYGFTHQREAPSEAQLIWKNWFGRDRTDGSNVSPDVRDRARRTIAAIETMLEGPFIAKDISNSLRVQALNAVFPGCLFVRICREPYAISKSILKARYEFRQERGFASTNDPKHEWIFIDSKDFEQFYGQHYLQQIASQIAHTERILDEDLGKLAADRHLCIDYREFCSNPRQEIRKLQTFAAHHRITLKTKAQIPAQFSAPKKYDAIDADQLRDRETLREIIETAFA